MGCTTNKVDRNQVFGEDSPMTKWFYNFNRVNEDFTGFHTDQALVVQKGRIKYVGSKTQVPSKLSHLKDLKKINLKGANVLPSFIECHTHTVFAGSRAQEFEMRNNGISYIEIAQKGGGILSTVKNTRAISVKELTKISQERVNQFVKQGVSTLEIKSGYGLDLETEIKILKVAKKMKGPQIVTTYLGAHAKPNEFASYKEYLEYILKTVLPQIKKQKLSNRVDIFVEKSFFEKEDADIFLKSVKAMGFAVVVHANQLSDSGGVDLALKYQAKSADHAIHLTDQIIEKWKSQKTVAVLLPVADLYMKCPYPPARKLIDAGVKVALSTDYNPGSSPSQDLMLVGLLARLEMKMTLPEVFKSYTLHAAEALGIEDDEGSLSVGKKANFIVTTSDLTDFFYSAGFIPEHELFIQGEKVKLRTTT